MPMETIVHVMQPSDDISCVAWNRQVQFILGSTSPSGRLAVWDLRHSKPVFQFSECDLYVGGNHAQST